MEYNWHLFRNSTTPLPVLYSQHYQQLTKSFSLENVSSVFIKQPLRRQPHRLEANLGVNKTEIPREAYEYMNDYFSPHNQALGKLTGITFGW